jgi:hypothetical protein
MSADDALDLLLNSCIRWARRARSGKEFIARLDAAMAGALRYPRPYALGKKGELGEDDDDDDDAAAVAIEEDEEVIVTGAPPTAGPLALAAASQWTGASFWEEAPEDVKALIIDTLVDMATHDNAARIGLHALRMCSHAERARHFDLRVVPHLRRAWPIPPLDMTSDRNAAIVYLLDATAMGSVSLATWIVQTWLPDAFGSEFILVQLYSIAARHAHMDFLNNFMGPPQTTSGIVAVFIGVILGDSTAALAWLEKERNSGWGHVYNPSAVSDMLEHVLVRELGDGKELGTFFSLPAALFAYFEAFGIVFSGAVVRYYLRPCIVSPAHLDRVVAVCHGGIAGLFPNGDASWLAFFLDTGDADAMVPYNVGTWRDGTHGRDMLQLLARWPNSRVHAQTQAALFFDIVNALAVPTLDAETLRLFIVHVLDCAPGTTVTFAPADVFEQDAYNLALLCYLTATKPALAVHAPALQRILATHYVLPAEVFTTLLVLPWNRTGLLPTDAFFARRDLAPTELRFGHSEPRAFRSMLYAFAQSAGIGRNTVTLVAALMSGDRILAQMLRLPLSPGLAADMVRIIRFCSDYGAPAAVLVQLDAMRQWLEKRH